MRKVLPVVFACIIGIGVAHAAVRDASTVSRTGNVTQNVPTAHGTARASNNNIVSRTGTNQTVRVRPSTPNTVARTTSSRNISRTTTTTRGTTRTATTARGATATRARATTTKTARAGIEQTTNTSQAFGTGYNACRDAYFTCMDQFCASADDTYRRCICSSRLYEIKNKQRALDQSADQLQDFKDLNIAAIPKTAAEVKAMQTASEGEMVSSIIKDKSSSIAQLAGISAVLSSTKSKSLSTAGKLDIAGDINAIWATTDLTSGLNISNLTGETLYSAVHNQCVNLVSDHCSSKSLLNMVVSAYSMYIENDCSLLATSLSKQKLSANASIRETEREMNAARLENYDAHNSSSINECIALVRRDVTADAACGANYVHCLDTTGLYLNRTNGEPIYTSNFYLLGSTLSLSGDILTNDANRALVLELNRKRMFAENSLDTCRDLADDVWDEFMRQAITEIYQGQQTKIRDVKNECLDVVNQCYDTQSNSLKDFSNIKEQLLLGSRLELSEELCREKLTACSNLYGGGPNGMQELLTAMSDITTQRIAQNCFATLRDYAKDLCAVPSSDSLHSYPYACRAYAPGEHEYASIWDCNKETKQSSTSSSSAQPSATPGPNPSQNVCLLSNKRYTRCAKKYYMVDINGDPIYEENWANAAPGNRCVLCPGNGMYCPKQSEGNPDTTTYSSTCGPDYVGSLYQKLVRYAVQACLRPSDIIRLQETYRSETDVTDNNDTEIDNLWNSLSVSLLQDVDATMNMVRVSMASALKTECERLGGNWVSAQWDETADASILWAQFYNETGANKKWGYCADPDAINKYYGMDDDTSTTEGGNQTGGSSTGSENVPTTSGNPDPALDDTDEP